MNTLIVSSWSVGVYYLLVAICVAIFVVGTRYISTNASRWQVDKTNTIFCCVIAMLYLASTLINFATCDNLHNVTTPLDNVSPMLFFLVVISLFVGAKWKSKLYDFFCEFFPAMILAGLYVCLTNIGNKAPADARCTLDVICHVTFALFCYYLLASKQFVANKTQHTIHLLNMLTVITLLMTVNYFFGTSYFGLDMYGKHNIYGIVVSTNAVVSHLTYTISVLAVMTFGYALCKDITTSTKK